MSARQATVDCRFKIKAVGVGEMCCIQWLRALAAFTEDPSSVPSSHTRWLLICNSSSRTTLGTSTHTHN